MSTRKIANKMYCTTARGGSSLHSIGSTMVHQRQYMRNSLAVHQRYIGSTCGIDRQYMQHGSWTVLHRHYNFPATAVRI